MNLLTGLKIDEYFSRTDSAGPATILADALGSTLGLTNTSGALNTTYTYEPFGNVMISGAANANSYQFTGRENDGTGLYYYRARYYLPGLERFASQDPIDSHSGDQNLYTYVLNQPTDLRDPTGMQAEVITGEICDLDPDLCIELGQFIADAIAIGAGAIGSSFGPPRHCHDRWTCKAKCQVKDYRGGTGVTWGPIAGGERKHLWRGV